MAPTNFAILAPVHQELSKLEIISSRISTNFKRNLRNRLRRCTGRQKWQICI